MSQHSIQVALELAQKPWLARQSSSQPLREDILDLIKLAAGCNDTCRELQRVTGRSPEVLRQVATHYLHVALFFPGASSTRILGLPEGATRATMIEHRRWLIKWLHPDRNDDVWETAHLARVMMAWDELNVERTPFEGKKVDISIVEKIVQAPIVRRGPPSPARGAANERVVALRMPANRVGLRRFGIAVAIVCALALAGSGGALVLLELYGGAADARIVPETDLSHISFASPGGGDAERCVKRPLAVCDGGYD